MSGDLVTVKGEPIAKGRISPALRTALVLIVHEALTVAEAAQRTGYKAESLAKALLKPHVRAEKSAVKAAWLGSATERAWHTVVTLADGAASEDIRLKAAKVILDAAGELEGGADKGAGPRTLVQIVVNHAPQGEHSPGQRLPGVIEAQPLQRLRPDPSNFDTVGRVQ